MNVGIEHKMAMAAAAPNNSGQEAVSDHAG
jgi:hypothetical protein